MPMQNQFQNSETETLSSVSLKVILKLKIFKTRENLMVLLKWKLEPSDRSETFIKGVHHLSVYFWERKMGENWVSVNYCHGCFAGAALPHRLCAPCHAAAHVAGFVMELASADASSSPLKRAAAGHSPSFRSLTAAELLRSPAKFTASTPPSSEFLRQ